MRNIIHCDAPDTNTVARISRPFRRESSGVCSSWDTSAPPISVCHLKIAGAACSALDLDSSVIAAIRSPSGEVGTRRNSVVTVLGAQ